MPSDFDLLAAWRDGDEHAGNELFHRHFGPVRRFFRNKVPEEVAEDLIQRTFLACVESRDRFRGDASFRTYLFVIARNELYSHLKRARKEARAFDPGQVSIEDTGLSPSRVMAQRAEHRLLLEALRHLPVEQQLLLELFYWEGQVGRELALILDVPEGTVRSRLRLARRALVRSMQRLASSPDVLESTLADLDKWARGLRDLADEDPEST